MGNTSIISEPGWKRAVKDMQRTPHSRKPSKVELKCLVEKLAQLGLSGNDQASAARSFERCLSRTSEGKSKEFIDVFVPKFLESASIFGTDSMKALSYLPDRKVMDGEGTLNQWNRDWNYIFKEFDSCAISLVSNCTICAGEALVLTHDFKRVESGESFFYSRVFHVSEGQITALLEVGWPPRFRIEDPESITLKTPQSKGMEFALEIIQKAREFMEGKNGSNIPTIKEFEESLIGRLTLIRI